MLALFNLIRNENMKIYRRWRTWVLIGITLIVLIGMGAIVKHTDKPAPPNWKDQLQTQIQSMKTQMNNPSVTIPPEVKAQLQSEIAMDQYAIDHNIPPDQNTGVSFTKDASALISLLTIFTIVVAGDSVASEFGWGTIKLLLVRPASRTKILWSKFLATLLFGLFQMAILLVGSYVLGGLLFGFGGWDQPFVYSDASGIHQLNMFGSTMLTYGLKAISLLMYVTIAFMISAAFRSSALAISLSILIMFVGNIIVALLQSYSWVKYVIFANLDLTQYILGNAPDGMTMRFSLIVLAVYFVVLHACAWLLFVKRDVAA